MKLTSPPKLSVSSTELPLYQPIGNGFTDNLFLIGHADGIPLNDPIRVTSIREAVQGMGFDTDSPLLRGLLEAYYSGARDIWIVAAAPMSEYEPIESRGQTYYQQYFSRLQQTYTLLKDWEAATIITPIGAPFDEYEFETDFLRQLVLYCAAASVKHGRIHMGIMGSDQILTDDHASELLDDGRLNFTDEPSWVDHTNRNEWLQGQDIWQSSLKHVGVFLGQGAFSISEMPVNYTAPVSTAIAATLASLPFDRGITNRKLRTVSRMVGPNLGQDILQQLSEKGLNPVVPDYMGLRGEPFRFAPLTDNTLAPEGSDYWSLLQMRLVTTISADIHNIGNRSIGTIGYDIFRRDVRDYMAQLVSSGSLRDYTLNIERSPDDRNKVLVHLIVYPFFGIREINVDLVIGPNKG